MTPHRPTRSSGRTFVRPFLIPLALAALSIAGCQREAAAPPAPTAAVETVPVAHFDARLNLVNNNGLVRFDGTVDTADYVTWRNGLGTLYSPSHYNIWRANFGASLGPGSGSAGYPLGASAEPLSGAVPEPASLALLAATAVAGLALCRIRPSRCIRDR